MNEDVDQKTSEHLTHPNTSPILPSTKDYQVNTRDLASVTITTHFVV